MEQLLAFKAASPPLECRSMSPEAEIDNRFGNRLAIAAVDDHLRPT